MHNLWDWLLPIIGSSALLQKTLVHGLHSHTVAVCCFPLCRSKAAGPASQHHLVNVGTSGGASLRFGFWTLCFASCLCGMRHTACGLGRARHAVPCHYLEAWYLLQPGDPFWTLSFPLREHPFLPRDNTEAPPPSLRCRRCLPSAPLCYHRAVLELLLCLAPAPQLLTEISMPRMTSPDLSSAKARLPPYSGLGIACLAPSTRLSRCVCAGGPGGVIVTKHVCGCCIPPLCVYAYKRTLFCSRLACVVSSC